MKSFLQELLYKQIFFQKIYRQIFFFTILFFLHIFSITAQNYNYQVKKIYKYEQISEFSLVTDGKATIFIPFENGLVKALDIMNDVKWQTDLGGQIASDLIFDESKVFLLIRKDVNYFLTSLSSETGLVIWQREVDASDNVQLKLVQNNVLIHKDKDLTFINKNNPKEESGIKLTDNEYFDFIDFKVKQNFDRVFTIILKKDLTGNVLLTDNKGVIANYNLQKNKIIWKKETGGQILNVDLIEDKLLVSSSDNLLYFFKVKTGKLIWKIRFRSNINENPILLDKNLVGVTVYSDNNFYIIDLKKGKILEELNLCDKCYISKSAFMLEKNYIIQTSDSIIIIQK